MLTPDYITISQSEEWPQADRLNTIRLLITAPRVGHTVLKAFVCCGPIPFSIQLLSCVQLFPTPWTAACQASLSISNFWSLLKLMSNESVMPSSHLILCRPLLLLPPILPRIRVFSNESTLRVRWPMYWSFSFSISPSKEIPGLISFRMHWLDLPAVQGTLKSLLQHHSSKASILRRSAFFTVQPWEHSIQQNEDHQRPPWLHEFWWSSGSRNGVTSVAWSDLGRGQAERLGARRVKVLWKSIAEKGNRKRGYFGFISDIFKIFF